MLLLPQEFRTIESLLSRVRGSKEGMVIRRIADRFRNEAHPLSPVEANVYDEVVYLLAKTQDSTVRAQLARDLAPVGAGPVATVQDLAADPDARVAGPVLEHSPLVSESRLIEVAATRGEDHLRALAARTEVPVTVTDLIVLRGSWPVLRAVAGNGTAHLSRTSLERLVHAAKCDGTIIAGLLRRSDVPVDLSTTLLGQLSALARGGDLMCDALLRDPLLRRGEDSGVRLDDREPLASLDRERSTGLADLMLAAARIDALHRRGRLNDRDLLQCLNTGRWSDTLVVLAHLAGTAVTVVASAFDRGDGDAALAVLRLAGVDWPIAAAVLQHQWGSCLAPGALEAHRSAYGQMSRAAAEQTLRALRGRVSALMPGDSPQAAAPM